MSRWPLVVPPLLLCLSDVALTLAGQSASYWAGDYARVDEVNPLARIFLLVSPWLFLAFAVAWAAAFVAVLTTVPSRWAVVIAYLVAAGHTVGSATWLLRLGRPGLFAMFVLPLTAGYVLGRFPTTAVCPNEGERLQ